jgi:hypothetical protein
VKDISIVAKQKKKLSRPPSPPTASENLQRDSIVAFWAALFLFFFLGRNSANRHFIFSRGLCLEHVKHFVKMIPTFFLGGIGV